MPTEPKRGSMSKGMDIWYTYQFLKRLSTPWEETQAFQLGLLDKKGKRIRKPRNTDERNAYTLFDRMVFNTKRLMQKFGLKDKTSTFAAALFLLKEQESMFELTDSEARQKILSEKRNIQKQEGKTIQQILEDAPTMSTGASIAGTEPHGVHWAPAHPTNKRKKHKIDGMAFLRRQRDKEKKEQLSAAEKMIKKAKQQAASRG